MAGVEGECCALGLGRGFWGITRGQDYTQKMPEFPVRGRQTTGRLCGLQAVLGAAGTQKVLA